MDLQGFEKICANVDILIVIYEFLDFRDQIMLSCVNDNLKSVFSNNIHKEAFKDLTIAKTRYVPDVIVHGWNSNLARLQPDELNYFLAAYAEQVQSLNISSPTNDSSTVADLVNIALFRNISSLTFNCKITNEYVEFIGQSCPQLQSINLSTWIIGCDDRIDTLLAMGNLKRLILTWYGVDRKLFRKLVTRSHLESLEIRDVLSLDIDDDGDETTVPQLSPPALKEFEKAACCLKELTIKLHCCFVGNQINFSPILEICDNLVKLVLKEKGVFTASNLNDLAVVCQNLQTLYISHASFEDLESFVIPPKLSELSLNYCRYLDYAHLKKILTEFKITKFNSKHTKYSNNREEFRDYNISPLIKTFGLDKTYIIDFKMDTTNIDQLTVYGYYFRPERSNWPVLPVNLKSLRVIGWLFASVKFLLLLQNLNTLELKMKIANPLIEWSYITTILTLSSLNELTIDITDTPQYVIETPNTVAFPINLRILKLSKAFFKSGLNFLLDLFNRNRRLKLVCTQWSFDYDFLKTMLHHDKFPKDMKNINICDCTMNCEWLRNNIDGAARKPWYDGISNHIILCRKY